jgi:hypothetical protein
MAMTELADRFGPFAEVLVASQENIAGTGFDYATIFAPLSTRPDLTTAESLASAMVESFENQYRGNALGADTLSAVRTSAVPALKVLAACLRIARPRRSRSRNRQPELASVRRSRLVPFQYRRRGHCARPDRGRAGIGR